MRWSPDLKDYGRPTDNLTALQLASVRDRYYVTRHLALSVSSFLGLLFVFQSFLFVSCFSLFLFTCAQLCFLFVTLFIT